MAMQLKLATSEDAPAITALVRAAYAKWVPLIGREPLPMTVDYADAVTRHRFDLLTEMDTLVALIETDVRPDHLWIENIAVHPQHQGRGLGRQLLAHAETLAAALPELRLVTNGAFVANIRLYQAVGYAITHTEAFMNGTAVHMTKAL